LDENNAIRAITIGVSTFIAVMTISAVMMYYNTARGTVEAIGTGEDIAGNYAEYIQDLLVYNNTTDGTGVKNILNYFYMNDRVTIDLVKMTNLGSVNGSVSSPVTYTENIFNINNDVNKYNNIMANIISSKNFKLYIEYYGSENRDIKNIKIEEIN